MHLFTEFVNPYLGQLLEKVKLDKRFVRGEGCYLFDHAGNRYLDCVAAYGALPFGHNPPEIWKAVSRFHFSAEPNFIQPSALEAAGELARRLIELAPPGLSQVTFANSGAEAVEAAIKQCRSATGRPGILAARNSFHGKTLGALSATGNPAYQTVFAAPAAGFQHIAFGDLAALENELQHRPDYYAAFMVEPIQGEGGIIEPPAGYLSGALALCRHYGVLLVLDEVQTGLGRTGKMFACRAEEVTPDILVLAKALGGGIVPIGACLSSPRAYNEDFALKHSSTFAANSLACRVGLQVLQILTRDGEGLLHRVRETGALLKEGLLELQRRYPRLVRSVRGRGLMLGLEFNLDRDTFPESLLGIMAEQELLTPTFSAYLLNVEKIRVAPTLNGNAVIRIEPPLIITPDQCREALGGIGRALACLNHGNTARFLSFLVGTSVKNTFPPFTPTRSSPVVPTADPEEGRFAFLVHPLDLQSYHQFDRSLLAFTPGELHTLTDKFSNLLRPFVISRTGISSICNGRAYGEFIAMPRTSEELMQMPRRQALRELKETLHLARKRGAGIVGLGAFTAVVSLGGLYLQDEGVAVTTGNSYTVVSAVEAVTAAMEKLHLDPATVTAAVVGAAGSIGKGIALLLAEKVAKLILIGNPKHAGSSFERLQAVTAEVYRYLVSLLAQGHRFPPGSMGHALAGHPDLPSPEAAPETFLAFARRNNGRSCPVTISTAIDMVLSQAGVVVSATNNMGRLIHPGNLKHGAVVCDISRPANVSEAVDRARPDVLVLDGGVVEVPGRPNLGWDFGFDQGLAYACMVETMMLGLERHYQHYSLGSSGITLETILQTREWAVRHGFKLAAFRSFNRPLGEERWENLLRARAAHPAAPFDHDGDGSCG